MLTCFCSFSSADGRARVEDILSDSCASRLTIAVSVFEAVVTNLLSGAVLVKHLKFLTSTKEITERFFDICRHIKPKGTHSPSASVKDHVDNTDTLRHVIAGRQNELKMFNDLRQLVQNFMELCSNAESGWYLRVLNLLLMYLGQKCLAFY